jgi:hypothetical protein
MPAIAVLRDLLQNVPARLEKLSEEKAASKSTPSKWSPKEELGHLLDSAANNHQRIVRAQSENNLAIPVTSKIAGWRYTLTSAATGSY